jgi:hypothetical protein
MVFAAAARGLVQRIVEGSGGRAPQPVTYWEFGNEPDLPLPYFWNPTFAQGGGNSFFTTAIETLVALDSYRKTSSTPGVQSLKFGLGSFATAAIAAATIHAFDTASIHVPVDFVSFHSYHDDPLGIVADIQTVAAARAASASYRKAELALTEWGPSLSDTTVRGATNMDFPMLVSTVISAGAAAGLTHTHQSIFWAFYDQLPFGLLNHDLTPKPLYWAYALLSRVVAGAGGMGATQLVPTGIADGLLDGGMGALLASRDPAGTTRVLLTNRNVAPRSVVVEVAGTPAVPSRVLVMTDASLVPQLAATTQVVTLPARSIALLEL